MNALFADTFYWIALAGTADSSHQRALDFEVDNATSQLVTTDEVLTEYLNFSPPHRSRFADGPRTVSQSC